MKYKTILIWVFGLIFIFYFFFNTNISDDNYLLTKFPLSEDELFGEWTSTESDWPISLEIKKNKDDIELKISDPNEDIAYLDLKESTNEYLVFYTEKNLRKFVFMIYEDNLTMAMSYQNNSNTKQMNAIRPFILKKVNIQ